MTKAQILEKAIKAKDENDVGDFFIGCTVDELLPNKNISKMVCVDCSWLRHQQKPIIDRNDLDEVLEDDKPAPISIAIDGGDLIFTKWMNMMDEDGDIHHCKVITYCTMSDNIFDPIEDYESGCLDYVIYVEV